MKSLFAHGLAAKSAALALALASWFGHASGLVASAASTVQVTDLGVLPGGDYSSARAINNRGQVVGLSTDAAHEYQTVIWSGGGITTITKCCPGGLPRIESINDSGEVVGWENGGYATSGIYWDTSGTAFVLPPLPGGDNRVFAYDINNAGIIVGQSRDGTLDRHAVVWDRTTLIRDLGFMGAASPGLANFTSARGINDLNDIVGQAVVGSDYRAFLWRNGTFTDLGLGSAFDINNQGLIAGWTSGQVPVVWRNGVMENLPSISGETIGYGHIVTGLNNNGDVVGYAPSPVGIGFRYTAVLWRGGKAINLGFFPGGTSSIAYGINDAGQIVGEGSIVADGPMHALLWTVGGATPPTATTLRSTAINLSGTRNSSRVNVSGQVVVRDNANAAASGVSVNVSWRKPDGTFVTQTATTGSSGTASFNTSGGRGTYTLTVNNLTKAGYTFDRANSVLTKSITK